MQRAVLMAMYEPSDKELSALMHDVATEAKKKAVVVKKQLRESIAVEIQKARLKLHTLKV
ncbi:MAG: hypothetical protein J0647_07410 [Campylobacteraceae bacterium]|nr:hypothetical protein [Campylobacteraceae bacterium]